MKRMVAVILPIASLAVGVEARADGVQLEFIDDPALGEFLDISISGGQIPLDDEAEAFVPVGYPGSYVFQSGPIVVGMNGGMNFGLGTLSDLGPVNQPIPSATAFLGSQAALPYWDDIDDKEGDVFFTSLDDRLIVQWNVANFDGAGSELRFQVQIFENPGPTGIYAQYLYRVTPDTVSAGAGATIGYQDGATGFGNIAFSFERDSIGDGTVLSLVIHPRACPEDFDDDGTVGFNDMTELLAHWGACAAPCDWDVDGSGNIGFNDLTLLLTGWGPCG